ncbi:MAG: ABC transporter substrate-binding protein [Promethearchaeota archaeon]
MKEKRSIVIVCLILIFMLTKGTDSANAVKFYNPNQLVRFPWGDATATAENPFTALAFRQAMSMAVDYNTFLNIDLEGKSTRLEGMIPYGMFGHHDTLLEEGILPTYQPDAAKALFDAVGWTGTIVFSRRASSNRLPNLFLNLKNSIEAMDVGITIEIEEVAWSDLLSMINQGSLPIFELGWGPDYADPDNYVGSFFHSELGYYAPMTGYQNPALDALLEQAAQETDVTVREQLYFDIEEMAVRDMAWLYLYQAQSQNYPRSWLEGLPASGWYNPMNDLLECLHRVNKINGTTDSPQNTYITETIGSPAPLDPVCNYEAMSRGMNAMVRDTLMMYKHNDTTLSPALALGYTISSDAKNITFYLRENVQFSDGSPFNAYVMKYSIDRACLFNDPHGPTGMITPKLLGGDYYFLDNPNVSEAISFLDAGGVTADDEFTLTIHQTEPYVPLLYALQDQFCSAISVKDVIENVPANYTTEITDDDFGQVPLTAWFPDLTEDEIRTYLGLTVDANLAVSGLVPGSRVEGETAHDYLNSWIVGTGPYIMTAYDPVNYIYEFERNSNYWGNNTGEDPFAANAVQYVKIYGEMNEATIRIQNLLDGKIDMTWVPATSLDLVRDPGTGIPETGLNYYEFPNFIITFAGFNMFDMGPAEFMHFNGSITGTSPATITIYPPPTVDPPSITPPTTTLPITTFPAAPSTLLPTNQQPEVEALPGWWVPTISGILALSCGMLLAWSYERVKKIK